MGNLEPEALGVYSTGLKTFVVELEEPTPYFLSLLTHATTYPVHPKSVEKHGAGFTRPGNLVSNGAFVLADWRVQDYIKLDSGRFGHRTGKITISALEPMRAIPHKVVILMGLEEQVFPRQKKRPSFNLLEQNHQLGDPRTVSYTHLTLPTICSV